MTELHLVTSITKGGYPARLKKVLIVTAPLWFKAPFKILRLFVREKLRERVFTVSIPQLSLHVPRDSLPGRLGGTLDYDHSSWLLHCYKSMTNREDEIIAGQQQQSANDTSQINNSSMGSGSATTVTTGILDPHLAGPAAGTTDLLDYVSGHHRSSSNNIDHIGVEDISDLAAAAAHHHHAHHNHHHHHNTSSELWNENPPSSASSGFSDDDSLAGAEGDPKTIEQIVQMVRERGKQGLIREYAEIKARAPDGTFTHAKPLMK